MAVSSQLPGHGASLGSSPAKSLSACWWQAGAWKNHPGPLCLGTAEPPGVHGGGTVATDRHDPEWEPQTRHQDNRRESENRHHVL